jgi:formylglycine-generating enzyme required for sulfatase activity
VAKTDTYGLYNTSMASTTYIAGITRSGSPGTFTYSVVAGSGNKPITYVSWFDAARFTNWMHNGQITGAQNNLTTEDGAYTLNGAIFGVSVTKNVGATVWIPSEDEWYKAAYFDPNKGGAGVGGYWLHANQSNTMTTNTVGVAGAANHYDGDYVGSGTSSYPTTNALTDVGAYGVNSESAYGTNDQGGNVWEWNDRVDGTSRGLRGGSYDSEAIYMSSTGRWNNDLASNEAFSSGFRVASIPEPTSLVFAMLTGGVVLIRRKK